MLLLQAGYTYVPYSSLDHGRINLAAAVSITGANRNPLKARLSHLVSSGELRLQKFGRGSWYEPAMNRN